MQGICMRKYLDDENVRTIDIFKNGLAKMTYALKACCFLPLIIDSFN